VAGGLRWWKVVDTPGSSREPVETPGRRLSLSHDSHWRRKDAPGVRADRGRCGKLINGGSVAAE
jgi:hypothetical protein